MSYKKLRQKAQALAVSKIIAGTKTGQGKMSYKIVSAKRGRLAVKKGLKKGFQDP